MQEPRRFEIGRYYQHTSGGVIRVCGTAHTHRGGVVLVAESTSESRLVPISDEASPSADGWMEIDSEAGTIAFAVTLA